MSDDQTIALAAAAEASQGLGELLRFASEGQYSHTHAFDFTADPIMSLTGALISAVDIDLIHRPEKEKADHEMLGQLLTALHKFREDWA